MRVFVSSTFDDLVDYRQAVDEILSRLSVQFRGMEIFGSRPAEPKKVCFEEIAASEAFVGIYAYRYGWIPEGESLSITEQEFDFARSLNIPCYCYVVDPTHPWNLQAVEFDARDNLKRFHTKIGTLVRSRFTTPDNLAKQVAADIIAAFTRRVATHSFEDLAEHLETCVAHEIATTVGTKYIRDLYVGRALDRALKLRLQQPGRTTALLKQLHSSISGLHRALHSVGQKEFLPADMAVVDSEIQEIAEEISKYSLLPTADHRVNYPAKELTDQLTRLRAHLSAVEKLHDTAVRQRNDMVTELRILSNDLRTATTSATDVVNVLRPVHLIVDRAGGGKTNLLCHLAETLGQHHPTFFFAAKSVPEPTEKALREYLASVYPIGADPIEIALNSISESEQHCIIIIDGINEHFDPKTFNHALKAFIRRYYNRPVKFLISCRDIYWRYFEDDWWINHGAFVSRDALYEFTRLEYKKVLPLYLDSFDIDVQPTGEAHEQLRHPLLLRFFCEAYRGTSTARTRIGRLAELRLLELFDAYCARKFEQIRARLGLLDSDEIFTYVRMIALTMVDARTRSLPVSTLARKARTDFGEYSIRTVDSRYVQILDEDILIEERPLGSLSEIVVSFVYDEFMEYIIARSLWSRIDRADSDNLVTAVIDETESLLSIRSEFISVTGIILYLGEMLAATSEAHLLRYLDMLRDLGKFDILCDLAVRIAVTHPHAGVFELILDLHDHGYRKPRHLAWNAIERMAPAHWERLLTYLGSNSTPGPIHGDRAFTLIRRVVEHVSPPEQFKALALIHRAIKRRGSCRIQIETSIDSVTGVNTAKRILAANVLRWSEAQSAEAAKLVEEMSGIPGPGKTRKIRSGWSP